MKLNDLYRYAEVSDIPVISFSMPLSESMSVLYGGSCYVGIDPMKLHSETEEKEKLAHELGHCATGAFYNKYAACDIRERHERKADLWAIKMLVPQDELAAACLQGYREPWELAEYFGVTEFFLRNALEFYRNSSILV